MSSIAIITARGGSKRIPKKNIREFCGKPIISYSIKAALDSGIFDMVMVSTDSDEIAAVARQYGAEVPFLRSVRTSDDFATTSDVIIEVLDRYAEQGMEWDIFACLYPTAPFVSAQRLRDAMAIMREDDIDSVIPVIPFSYPPQRGLVFQGKYIRYAMPQYERARSQDLEKLYHDCGQFYICRTRRFYNQKSLVMEHTIPFVINELEVQDIDNETDWKLAELKFKLLRGDKDVSFT